MIATQEETHFTANSPPPPPLPLPSLPPLFDINAKMKGTEALRAVPGTKKGKKKIHFFFGSEVFNFTSWPHLDQSLPTAAIIRGQSLRVFARALVVIATVKVHRLPTFHPRPCQEPPWFPRTAAVKGPVCKLFLRNPV